MEIIPYQQALEESVGNKRHLLIGNGFSIALFPNFSYRSLLEEANDIGLFHERAPLRGAFDALNTTDFEIVIESLLRTVAIHGAYGVEQALTDRLREDAAALKDILVRAIAGRHPARPSEISEDQFRACRTFLREFIGEQRTREGTGRTANVRGNVYTVNYDLLLYWTLLHDEMMLWDPDDPLNIVIEEDDPLYCDDGFRAPFGDPDAAYVAWDAEGASDRQNIHYLHGALHLFDRGYELEKCCWERAGQIPLMDQIRAALDDDRYPLFVAEGTTHSKLRRIHHSGYLLRSLKSFAGVCRNRDTSLFVFGHSFAQNDQHVLRQMSRGSFGRLFVSFHGDANSDANRSLERRVEEIVRLRGEGFPLRVRFFSSEEPRVWG